MKHTNQPMSKRAIVKLVTKKLGKGHRTTLRQVHEDVDTDVWVDT